MTITVTQLADVPENNTGDQTNATGSIAPSNNAKVYVVAHGQRTGGGVTLDFTISTTITGISAFTRLEFPTPAASNGDATFHGTIALWEAETTTPAAGTITVDWATSTGTCWGAFKVFEATGTVAIPQIKSGQRVANAASKAGGNSETHTTGTLPAAVTNGNTAIVAFGASIDGTAAAAAPTDGGSWTAVGTAQSAVLSTVGVWRKTDFTGTTATCSDLGQLVGTGTAVLFELEEPGAGGVSDYAAPNQVDPTFFLGERRRFRAWQGDLTVAAASEDHSTTGVLPVAVFPWPTAGPSHDATIAAAHLPVGVTPYATASRDASISAAHLPVAVWPASTVRHDASITAAHLPVAVAVYAPALHEWSTVGHLPAGIDLRALISHDATIPGHLPVAVAPYATILHNSTPVGLLPVGVDMRAVVSHDATVVGHLPVAVAPYATVSRTASVVGHLPVAVWLVGLSAAPVDINTTGVLYVAVWPAAIGSHDATQIGHMSVGVGMWTPYRKDATPGGVLYVAVDTRTTVTRTANVVGHLPAAVDLRTTATRTANVVGHLPIAFTPYATATHNTGGLAGYLPITIWPNASGAPVVVYVPDPARTFIIPHENRTYIVDAESRIYTVAADGRIYVVGIDGRLHTVAADPRRLIVPGAL